MGKKKKMKYNPAITSSRRKNRKAYFEANMGKRRKIMLASLYHYLKKIYSVNSVSVCNDDEIRIVRGMFRGYEGKVTGVYRNKWFLLIECAIKKKSNAQNAKLGINASNCIITKLVKTFKRKKISKYSYRYENKMN